MMPRIAFLDANVLYPAPLRDLLMQTAYGSLYRAHWSAEIEDEWKRNLISARPALAERIMRTQEVMRKTFPNALVTGYAGKVADIVLPDPNDRHVVAAAIEILADVIVTFNLRDFPLAALKPYGLIAQHPDEFLQSMILAMPGEVLLIRRANRYHFSSQAA